MLREGSWSGGCESIERLRYIFGRESIVCMVTAGRENWSISMRGRLCTRLNRAEDKSRPLRLQPSASRLFLNKSLWSTAAAERAAAG
jgi:hypothetical protein